jgi:hypothetical protein
MLAVSGATLAAGAPVALAACGAEEDEDVSPEREAELLNVVLAQQLAVLEAARALNPADATEELGGTIDDLARARGDSTQALDAAVTDLGGTPVSEPAELVGAESAVEAWPASSRPRSPPPSAPSASSRPSSGNPCTTRSSRTQPGSRRSGWSWARTQLPTPS